MHRSPCVVQTRQTALVAFFVTSVEASIFETTVLVCVTDGADCSGGGSQIGCSELNDAARAMLSQAAAEADSPAWAKHCGADADALSDCLHSCGFPSDGCFEMYPDYDYFSCSDPGTGFNFSFNLARASHMYPAPR